MDLPKGEFTDEDPLKAAKREFKEETGMDISGEFIPLTPLKQKSGKTIYVWLLEGDLDPTKIISNTFELEWPPKSGIKKQFPEIDKVEWFNMKKAKEKIIPGQLGFIEEMERKLKRLFF
ncbi:MAG: NUDIX domain-containing protein [Bacteroidota bacterium]